MADTSSATSAAPEAQPQPPRLDLASRDPVCFDWRQPRPLKVGLREDFVADEHPPKAIRRALGAYCSRVKYLKALRAGTPRIDLQGQPAGDVTEDDAANAQAMLSGAMPIPKIRAERPKEPTPTPALPQDAPLTPESSVTGRLELTVQLTNVDHDTQFVGELLQLNFPEPYPITVTAATIGRDQQALCVRVEWLTHRAPPPADTLNGKLRRVVRDPNAHPGPGWLLRQGSRLACLASRVGVESI